MTDAEAVDPHRRTTDGGTGWWRSEALPRYLFALYVLVALPLLLRWGAYHWFLRDEWAFLSGRSATSVDDLFRPHALSHWSTVPVVVYRALWQLVGARSYLPYQAIAVVLHLVVAVLLRALMRRAGVSGWIATLAAGSFVLFGPGQQNVVWAFQMGFTGSLALGFVQVLLAQHDGPIDRRDWLGLGAGVLALACSSVGITTAAMVGATVLLLRGWRAAAFHTVPLAAVYGVWSLIEDPVTDVPGLGRPSVRTMLEWLDSAERGTFLALGHYQVVAALLVLVLVAGLAVAWRRERGPRLAIPAGLLVGQVLFALSASQARWVYGTGFARASRYLYIGAALALPALAVAADALAKRWRALAPVVAVLLVVAIPANAARFEPDPVFDGRYFDEQERVLRTAVRVPFARDVPSDVRPIPDVFNSRTLTIGFLLDARRAGRFDPSSGPLTEPEVNEMRVRLGVAQRERTVPGARCVPRRQPAVLRPAKGTVFALASPVEITTVGPEGGKTSVPVRFKPNNGTQLTVELPDLALRVAPLPGQATFTLCEA